MSYLYGCLAICGGLILIAAIVALMISRAPYGWEDREGWHRGRRYNKK